MGLELYLIGLELYLMGLELYLMGLELYLMGLELYLMGLAPSSAIGSHDFVRDASFVGPSAQPRCNCDFTECV